MKVVTAAAALDTGRFNPQLGGQRRERQGDLGGPVEQRGWRGLRRHRPHLRADELGQHRLGPGRRVAGRSHHAALHGALRLLRGAAAGLSRRADVGVRRPQGRAARADDVRPRRRRPRRDRPGRPASPRRCRWPRSRRRSATAACAEAAYHAPRPSTPTAGPSTRSSPRTSERVVSARHGARPDGDDEERRARGDRHRGGALGHRGRRQDRHRGAQQRPGSTSRGSCASRPTSRIAVTLERVPGRARRDRRRADRQAGPRGAGLSEDDAFAAPDTLVDGRYRIIERIGSGGMADVYEAEDLQLGRRVALKLLYRRFAEDPDFVERFRREASSAAGAAAPERRPGLRPRRVGRHLLHRDGAARGPRPQGHRPRDGAARAGGARSTSSCRSCAPRASRTGAASSTATSSRTT